MADLSITPADVATVAGSGETFESGEAGAAIDAGESVYRSAADNEWYLADASAAATARARGVAVCSAAAGQRVIVQTKGKVDLGAGTQGETYVVSATAGGIAPIADLGSGEFVTVLGVCDSGNELQLNPWASEIAAA